MTLTIIKLSPGGIYLHPAIIVHCWDQRAGIVLFRMRTTYCNVVTCVVYNIYLTLIFCQLLRFCHPNYEKLINSQVNIKYRHNIFIFLLDRSLATLLNNIKKKIACASIYVCVDAKICVCQTVSLHPSEIIRNNNVKAKKKSKPETRN